MQLAPTPSTVLDQVAARQVRAFEIILAMVLVTEYWCRAIAKWHDLDAFLLGAVAGVTAFGALVIFTTRRRLGFAGLSLTLAAVALRLFPATGNHEYLELLFCLLCAGLDLRRPQERRLFVDAARWLVCVILFWAGVQKLLHGFYFDGAYLAYSLARESYRDVFTLLLSADELARLASYSGDVGAGPYRVGSPMFLLASNLTYAAEIALVPALLWRRTRRFAVLATAILLVAIQSAAREVFFCLVLGNAFLLFLDTDRNRSLIAPLAIALACLILVRAGFLPEVTFS